MADGKVSFGEYIKQLRNERKLTDDSFSLRGVAEKIGMCPTYLSKIERDILPAPAESIRKLANVLGVPADDLFAHADKIDPDLAKVIARHKEPAKLASFMRHAAKLSPERLEEACDIIDVLNKKTKKQSEGEDK